jgi:DNA-binding CsgD family transcriptional regulator
MKKYCSILQIFILLGVCQSSLLWAIQPETRIKNFTKKEYKAANQNWSVDFSENGFMYFANHKGLLEFDGASWQLSTLPHETILRAVYVDSDSLIYTAGYLELGYWKMAKTGKLYYTSLNHLADAHFSKNDEFWNIAKLDDKVYFQSFSKILVFADSSIIPLEFSGYANYMTRIKDKIMVAVSGQGIYSLDGYNPVPLIDNPEFDVSSIRFIIAYKEDQLLIGSSTNGIFVWDGMELKQWNNEWTPYFRKNEVNRAHINKNGDLIIGTITDGILVFDREEQLVSHYNSTNGLQNNTVLGITCDSFGNIWLALDNGIDFIAADTNHNFNIEHIPDVGSVYDAAFFEGNLFLGTNQGLFFRNINDGKGSFRLIPEVQGQVWFCKVIDDYLLVGFNGGIVSIKNQKINLISSQTGGFCIKEDPFLPSVYMVSTYNPLVRIALEAQSFREIGIAKGFWDLIRYVEFDHRGNIWASHMHRGIYKLQLNPQRDSIISTDYFGEKSPFGKDHNIHVFKIENRIIFTTGDSLFTYDDISDTIVSYNSLNVQTGIFASAHRIIEAPDHHYWFITRNEIGLFHIHNNVAKLINVIPRILFQSNGLIDGFENVYPTGPNRAIICLENGIATVELTPIHPSGIIKFKPVLREITLSGPRVADIDGVVKEGLVTIKYKHQNIRLRYSFPHYTHFPISFRSMLKGIDNDWKENHTGAVFNFDRLPEGTYEFLVKAVDPWGNESQQCIVKLEVLPPFYMSSVAKAGYFIMALALFFGLQARSINRTKKNERRRLEKREQELIRLRNEKLNNEVEHKSKELANLTMAIIKKNEFLMNLKEIFAHQKEQLGSRYPDKYFNNVTGKIDDNITNTDDWNLFETNFERAHEQFLQKLKDLFPDLTPKDLRLCAFLRMNLASKEIAPLLGISVRGVENHRYRLRKKMGLDHDDNLIEMILKL